MTSAVADAGPLLHLFEIDSISLLRVFESVFIPDAVWDETVGRSRIPAKALSRLNCVSRIPIPADDIHNFLATKALLHLQSGETEALFLCQSRTIPFLLTDDLAARDAAKALHITPVGSLGIVIRACREGLLSLPDAKARLRSLQKESSLFVTPAIVELAIAAVERDGFTSGSSGSGE